MDGLKSRLQSLHGYLEVMVRFTLCPGRSELKAIHRKIECTIGSLSMGMACCVLVKSEWRDPEGVVSGLSWTGGYQPRTTWLMNQE